MTDLEFFLVGGFIRDREMGIRSKDVDFSVVGADSFEHMCDTLLAQGFKECTRKEETFTFVAEIPKSHRLSSFEASTKVADFVWARKDGPSSDGRHPDFVEQGTRLDDQARRDFTVNSMAVCTITNELFDPFGGMDDIRDRVLRFVGDPATRVREDALRVLRGFRFMITKNFVADPETWKVLVDATSSDMLSDNSIVSDNRMQQELDKMFKHDSVASIKLLARAFNENPALEPAIFRDHLHCEVSLKHV